MVQKFRIDVFPCVALSVECEEHDLVVILKEQSAVDLCRPIRGETSYIRVDRDSVPVEMLVEATLQQ